MPLFGGAYTGPREVHYLFVDGASLHGRLKNVSNAYFNNQTFEIDFSKLVAHSDFTKVFYYDALPVRELGEDENTYNTRVRPQRELLNAAAGVDRIHVYEGDARRRRKVGLEQKKVDVMIAVDMLTHTFRRNMHKATLLSGDNDFKPLVDALVYEGMFITLWYPPGETSSELLNAADARTALTLKQLRDLLTNDSSVRFTVPIAANHRPDVAPAGRFLHQWIQDGKGHAIYRAGDDYIVTREHNELNRLHVRHSNKTLLQTYCKELNINIPNEAFDL
jgi:uncharacterized LabA/DUF88 family protein